MWGTHIPMELSLQWKGEPQGVIIVLLLLLLLSGPKAMLKRGKLLHSTTVTQCVDLWVCEFVCPLFSQHKG